MTIILGISALYHDSAAALVVDGKLVAAAQEERFSRIKHDASLPAHAVRFVLQQAEVTEADIDFVTFHEKPLLHWKRWTETLLSAAPFGFSQFRTGLPAWLNLKLPLRRRLKKLIPGYPGRWLFPRHHLSHAAAAFYPSPFAQAAIVTIDGAGEYETGCLGFGDGRMIRLTASEQLPHSVGLLYSAVTEYLGFRVNDGEYKVMGLAPYGDPERYRETLLREIVHVASDGSIRLQPRYFAWDRSLRMTSHRFHRLLGSPPRTPGNPLLQLHKDLAAAVQAVTEEIVLRRVRAAIKASGIRRVVLGGGVALNCVANSRILSETDAEDLWIPPAPGDAGSAAGAALLVWHDLLEQPRTPPSPDGMAGAAFGPVAEEVDLLRLLSEREASASALQTFLATDAESRNLVAAELLDAQAIIGWVQGKMEFGPRALGHRSLLADPRCPEMMERMNKVVKRREAFRPFAPACPEEDASDWFNTDNLPQGRSPYMLLTTAVRSHQIPAVTHINQSARLQTVNRRDHPDFYDLLVAFRERTACPVVLNTSFNLKDEPIVCTAADALRCFESTAIDVLIVGNRFVTRPQTPAHEIIHRHLN